MLTALRTNCQYQEGARQELGISESFMNVLLECGVVQSREINKHSWLAESVLLFRKQTSASKKYRTNSITTLRFKILKVTAGEKQNTTNCLPFSIK